MGWKPFGKNEAKGFLETIEKRERERAFGYDCKRSCESVKWKWDCGWIYKREEEWEWVKEGGDWIQLFFPI